VPCGYHWFQQKPVYGLVWVLERREVDLAVPALQELVVRGQLDG
jgi:hypothetical protein